MSSQTDNNGHSEQKSISRPYFDEVYLRYWKELYEVARRRLQSEEDAEDILQDVFLQLLKDPGILAGEGSVRAYLHQALKGKIIDFYRRSLLKETFAENAVLNADGYTFDPEERLAKKEIEALLEIEINKMPQKMRAVFLMSRKKMLTNQEIAQELSLSDQTVRNQISAAIKRIRAAFRQYNLADDTGIIMIVAAVLLRKF